MNCCLFTKNWNLNMPNKQKIFTWKCSWNYLPTLANLHHRHLHADQSCPKCKREGESLFHVFRVCPESRALWNGLDMVWVLNRQDLDNWNWLTWVFTVANNNLCVVFCYALWIIWNARNKLIHEDKKITGSELASQVLAMVEENKAIVNRKLTSTAVLSIWEPTIDGFIRINFDAAFNPQQFKAATGLVVRDSSGAVLVSKSVIDDRIATPFASEASDCVHAVRLGLQLGLEKVEIEGDSLTTIKKCQSNLLDRSEIGSFIREIQEQRNNFHDIIFKFIRRKANRTAHIIATESLHKGEEFYLIERVPPFAADSLGLDISMVRDPD